LIVGVFLRYIKIYQGINYIPLSTGEKFCGIVGYNGVGKSSILEAFDSIFNGRNWNLNIATKKSGTTTINPYIVPVFLIQRSFVKNNLRELAKNISDSTWKISSEEINAANRNLFKTFEWHRGKLAKQYNNENYFLLPIGLDKSGNISTSIFDYSHFFSTSPKEEILTEENHEETEVNQEAKSEIKDLFGDIKNKIEYIYIPREIDPEHFTKLETKEIQVLMGETLHERLEQIITSESIKAINANLNGFIDELSQDLVNYSYRTPTNRQQNLRKSDVYNLVIEAFFGIRKLHKQQGSNWLEIGFLSSGEKQRAIIDVAHNLLHHHRDSGKNLIIAIDEPESSLHVSACFDQINALFDISQACRQLLFATHWYGFFPTIDKGNVSVISKKNGSDHYFDLINLGSYKEEAKQVSKDSKGELPYDFRLKSVNDFVQSIISSTVREQPYNWIICEGSSDKIYLEQYFKDIKENINLRIIPVGGAREISRIYRYLSTSYEDFKTAIKGKILLISDTDIELVEYDTQDYPNLICKRIVNTDNDHETKLVGIKSNPKSPKTEIEDVLNGKLFYKTLKEFKQQYPDLLAFVNDTDSPSEIPSYFALDLKISERAKLDEFFDKDDKKYEFAKKYVDLFSDQYLVPDWIQQVKNILTNNL
jgi:predicted ATPase